MNKAIIEIRGRIQKHADHAMKAKLERLVPGAKTIGVAVPQLRALAAEYRGQRTDLPLEGAADLFDEFCRSGQREEILFGTFLLGKYGKQV